jgi:hypothetical protein
MTNTTTHITCTECGAEVLIIGTRIATLLNHMVNAGEISVGEARQELASGFLPADAVEALAGWVIARSDQDDSWRAGDPEALPCGCVVSYDREQVGVRCDGPGCVLGRVLVTAP